MGDSYTDDYKNKLMITNAQIIKIAKDFNIDPAMFLSFIKTESGGEGFNNGKLLIQFEPIWFKRKTPYAPSGKWSVNKVDVQTKEWEAFNDAYSKNPNAAMESTSIGMPQIMGFHWRILGYRSVGDMWDDFKKGEFQQIHALARFIKVSPKLYTAIKAKNFDLIASIYNGASYKEMAKKWGREPYNITLKKWYNFYKSKIEQGKLF